MIYAVIGSHYGDEGKGLAVDYLSLHEGRTLVVRHNGGAQSGHTVELPGKRFVFHELSSGSFRGADTYWADSFLPDLYKLGEEISAFRDLTGMVPRILASPDACITTVDDVLVNMLLESSRGDRRHGSCGMGINEADLRGKAGFAITLRELRTMTCAQLIARLQENRRGYTVRRLAELRPELSGDSPYYELLGNPAVLEGYAETVLENLPFVTELAEPGELFSRYENVVFENGQGLRLDAEFAESLPHVTASRTGLPNVLRILAQAGKQLDEVVYVSRSYLTKHGAGAIPNEDRELKSLLCLEDQTNVPNEWQGTLRYSRWADPEDFARVIRADRALCPYPAQTALLLTHLNETDHRILLQNGSLSLEEFLRREPIQSLFGRVYLSDTHFAQDIRRH